MNETVGVKNGGAHWQSFVGGKPRAAFSLVQACQLVRWSLFVLMAFAIVVTTQTPAWSAGVTDLIWLESNSTAGNSILTFRNNGTGNPTFLGSTPAGGIGVFDNTFALGPFDSDQNLIVNDDGTLLFG
jgi:hypothetical protein